MNKLAYIKKIIGSLWLISSLLLGAYSLTSHPICDGEDQTQKNSKAAETATSQLHGEVEVSFKIGEDGKANIISIKSENPDLIDYVTTKLNKIQLQKGDINLEEIITYRFIFKDEA